MARPSAGAAVSSMKIVCGTSARGREGQNPPYVRGFGAVTSTKSWERTRERRYRALRRMRPTVLAEMDSVPFARAFTVLAIARSLSALLATSSARTCTARG
jgi:hypothetical protein